LQKINIAKVRSRHDPIAERATGRTYIAASAHGSYSW
jgi:hypothetical protein